MTEAVTDPNVPPMPPHVSFHQAKACAKAFLEGDPDAWATLRASFRDTVESFLPHSSGKS